MPLYYPSRKIYCMVCFEKTQRKIFMESKEYDFRCPQCGRVIASPYPGHRQARFSSMGQEERLKFSNRLKILSGIVKQMAKKRESLLLPGILLYTSPEGIRLREMSKSVLQHLADAHAFRNFLDKSLHNLCLAYNGSVKVVKYLLDEKAFHHLHDEELFKELLKEYSKFQAMIVELVRTIDKEFIKQLEDVYPAAEDLDYVASTIDRSQ